MVTAVTGATGHVGANLVRALLAEGRAVRALARSDRRALEGLPVETIEGDIGDKRALVRLLDGAETAFHVAGRISVVGAEAGLVEKTNVQGVRNVVEACLERRIRRLVHFSTIHAFSSLSDDQVIDETQPLALGPVQMPYDRSKALGQLAVLEGVSRGLDAVIVNPAAVVGPYDFKPSRMGAVFLDIYHRRLPALLDGGFNWVDVRDVCSGALAAERKGRAGECYLLAGHWVHLCELSAIIGRLTGRPTAQLAIPLWLAMPAAYFSLAWGLLSARTPKFTPFAVRSIRMHRRISYAKAARELGYRPRPFEETVRDTMEWFARAGMLEEYATEPEASPAG